LASEQWANQWKHYEVEDLEEDFDDLQESLGPDDEDT
jgi:hypothetical protein